jgi:hypothetical protein
MWGKALRPYRADGWPIAPSSTAAVSRVTSQKHENAQKNARIVSRLTLSLVAWQQFCDRQINLHENRSFRMTHSKAVGKMSQMQPVDGA